MPGETEYCLLGPLVVRCAGAMVPVPPGKQRVLLAALLLRAGQRVGRRRAHRGAMGIGAAAFGAGEPAELRDAAAAGAGERRRPDSRDPAGRIPDPGRSGRAGRAPGSRQRWRRAGRRRGRGRGRRPRRELAAGLALWRGEPLADVPSDALAAREVPRLAELRLQALEARIDADLHLGRHAEVIAELRQLTAAAAAARAAARAADDRAVPGRAAGRGAGRLPGRPQRAGRVSWAPSPARSCSGCTQQVLAGDPVLAGETGQAPTGRAAGQVLAGSTAGAGEVRCSLPPDTAAFTGRDDELDRITAAVPGRGGSGGVVAIRAIDGMPGVGKTALAVHAAHLLRDRFPDRQLFIDLRGHTPGQDPLRPGGGAGRAAGRGRGGPPVPARRTWRAGRRCGGTGWPGSGRCWCWTTRPAAPRSPRCCRAGTSCLVLVTSRRHLADLPGAVVPVLLETLPPDRAREMFMRLAPRAAADPAAAVAELAELAGFLPLAISLLARVLQPAPVLDAGGPGRRDPGEPAHPDRGESTASPPRSRCPGGTWTPGQQDFFRRLGLHPGTDDRRLRRRRAGRHPAGRGRRAAGRACTARAC